MNALDAIRGGWILLIFLAAYFWYPSWLLRRSSQANPLLWVAGNWARGVFGITAGISVLSRLRAVDSASVILLLAAVATLRWTLEHRQSTGGRGLHRIAIQLLQRLEGQPLAAVHFPSQPEGGSEGNFGFIRISRGTEWQAATLAAVLLLTCVLAGQHALTELRPDQPAEYTSLLQARQITLGLQNGFSFRIFPSMIAATSLLSGQDEMEVARFLVPATNIFLVLSLGLLIWVCTKTGMAAVAGMYALGAAAFPLASAGNPVAPESTREALWRLLHTSPSELRPTPEFALGLVFVLLGIALLGDWHRNSRDRDVLVDFVCCWVLAGSVSITLAALLALGAAVVLLQPLTGAILLALAFYGIAACPGLLGGSDGASQWLTALPVAAALAGGGAIAMVNFLLVRRAGAEGEAFIALLCVALALTWFPPHRLPARYLEYESAARATQQIAHQLPRETWTVVAPAEQLPETLGSGAHMDLARFVESYREQATRADFHLPAATEHLFIFVEKQPFQIFAQEPQAVSFAVLTDPTYVNYRSPGGRASLEAAALEMCESYRSAHAGMDIFFENQDLRIYHLDERPVAAQAR
jgi:hypothetical protein